AFDDDLLVRAADVCRKEGRKVVLVPRECPLSPAHLRNMLQVAEDGYTVLPPVLSFYNGAKTTDEQVDHIVGKILMQFGLPYDKFHPWEG
ncbi:MAG: flavoprotein, partial [Olsenella sp.]